MPAPKNRNLPVLTELPSDAKLDYGERSASRIITQPDDKGKMAAVGWEYFHFCRKCKGWIPGKANSFHENTLGVLSGREGIAYHCQRCGKEIYFFGKIS